MIFSDTIINSIYIPSLYLKYYFYLDINKNVKEKTIIFIISFAIDYEFSTRFVDIVRLIGPQRRISHIRGSECDIRVSNCLNFFLLKYYQQGTLKSRICSLHSVTQCIAFIFILLLSYFIFIVFSFRKCFHQTQHAHMCLTVFKVIKILKRCYSNLKR